MYSVLNAPTFDLLPRDLLINKSNLNINGFLVH